MKKNAMDSRSLDGSFELKMDAEAQGVVCLGGLWWMCCETSQPRLVRWPSFFGPLFGVRRPRASGRE